MVDLAARGPSAVDARRPLRRRWQVLIAVALIVVSGAITAVVVSFRYLHATPLSTDGGGWMPPDNAHVDSVDAGPYTASVIAPRPGHSQTFQLDLNNNSGVTQTVIGLVDARTLADPRQTGEPQTLTISTSAVYPAGRTPVRYSRAPVAIPPHGRYGVRFTQLTGARSLWSCGRTESFTDLALRVRVGAFTRIETVHFGNLILEIKSSTTC